MARNPCGSIVEPIIHSGEKGFEFNSINIAVNGIVLNLNTKMANNDDIEFDSDINAHWLRATTHG